MAVFTFCGAKQLIITSELLFHLWFLKNLVWVIMHCIKVAPVAFSLMASFMSAITLLGVTQENYTYGTQVHILVIYLIYTWYTLSYTWYSQFWYTNAILYTAPKSAKICDKNGCTTNSINQYWSFYFFVVYIFRNCCTMFSINFVQNNPFWHYLYVCHLKKSTFNLACMVATPVI